jgi:hypothetical protein
MPHDPRTGKIGRGAKCLYAVIVGMALMVIATIAYLASVGPNTTRQGSAGPVTQNSPNHDPPPKFMQ